MHGVRVKTRWVGARENACLWSTRLVVVGDLGHSLFKNKEVEMTTGPGAVPRLGDPVAHQSATARGVACVVGGVLVRELGGRWGAGRLGAAGFTARCAVCVHGAGCLVQHRPIRFFIIIQRWRRRGD